MGTPTKNAIIGQFVNGRNSQDDFLQLATNNGGTVFAWIDYLGHLNGTFLSGLGTVTSVGFVGDGTLFSTTPSTPVTISGNISPTLLTHPANTVLSGPSSGPNAAPTFRALVAADLPAGSVPIGSAGQSAYFSATNTISGGSVELDMAGIAGADVGAKMNNCMAALPAAGGKCKGDNLTGALVLSTAVTTNKAVVFTFCGQQVTQTANINLNSPDSAIVGCPGTATIFTKGANIDQITLSKAQVVVSGIQLEGVKGSFTGNGISTVSGAAQVIIQNNAILDQANDAIYDNTDSFAGNIITGNSLYSWGNHGYESTVSSPQSIFSNNYMLGDGTATGAAILNSGSSGLLGNFITDSNGVVAIDCSGAGQGHPITGNRVRQLNGWPTIKAVGVSVVTANTFYGGGSNGACVLMVGSGGVVSSNSVESINADGIATSGAQQFLISNNNISLVLSGVGGKAGIRAAGDQVNGRTHHNLINISCNTANLNYGLADVPTGTHNLGMVFDGDVVSTTLSGGATVNAFLLDNTAGLNSNWQVTVQNLGGVHCTKILQRIDAQNNKTLYLNIQPEDSGLDVGTGSTADVFAFDNLDFTFATLPSPAGNGSRFYCSDCTQAKPTAGSGGGAYVIRESGQWNGI